MTGGGRKRWNPLEMDELQASNLALLVGLGSVAFFVVFTAATGFTPNTALLGLIGSGLIAQRWLFGRRQGGTNERRTRPDAKGSPVADESADRLRTATENRDVRDVDRDRRDTDGHCRRILARLARRPARLGNVTV